MNIRKLTRAEQRVSVGYIQQLGIKSYGQGNTYPQEIENIVRSSSTGSACVDRYARFIEGDGFNELLADVVVSNDGSTANDVLSSIANDLAMYGGFAIHVNYDIFCKITDIQHVPFEWCRLEEGDDTGYIGGIAVHQDWTGTKTKNGKRMKVTQQSVQHYHVFNPYPPIVSAQISKAGGIESYTGQILYVGANGRMAYPTPKADRVITEMSTDEGLANIKFRNVRCNFLTAQMLITKQDQTLEDDYGMSADGFASAIERFQGDEKANNILQMTISNEEEKPEIVEFPTKNFDKDFNVTDQSVVERIYCAYEQEPFLAIRNGRLGFSGTVVRDAYNYYASLVTKEQKTISRAFASIFDRWAQVLPSVDTFIKPIKFVADE